MIYQCQIHSDLLEGLGIEVTISRLTTERNGSKANTSYLKMGKIPPVSPIHPAEQNHEGTCQKKYWRYFKYRSYHISSEQNASSPKYRKSRSKMRDWRLRDILLISRDGCTTLVEKHTTVIQQPR